jgi:hypothetical protein
MQPDIRDDRGELPRETIDPDDFTGARLAGRQDGAGFALWSGTSFAAPYVAAKLAAELAGPLMSGSMATVPQRVEGLRKAKRRITDRLNEEGARRT